MLDYFTGLLLAPIIHHQFGSYVKDLECLLDDKNLPMCLRRVGNQSLTTLGITSNYFIQPYVNEKDMGFAFLY